jgi:hypothetical protein
MRLEPMQRDAPEVEATAADIGEVRAAVRGLLMGEAVELMGDEGRRMPVADDERDRKAARQGSGDEHRPDDSTGPVAKGHRVRAVGPGGERAHDEYPAARQQRRSPGVLGELTEGSGRCVLQDTKQRSRRQRRPDYGKDRGCGDP